MTRIKHLAARLVQLLADGFTGATPYYGAPFMLRAFGMGGPLPYRFPRRSEDPR
jgi:hypothetical protein